MLIKLVKLLIRIVSAAVALELIITILAINPIIINGKGTILSEGGSFSHIAVSVSSSLTNE